MFSITNRLAARSECAPADDAAQASGNALTGALPPVDAVTRNEVAGALRAGGSLDDSMQRVALSLISALPCWPKDIPPGMPASRHGVPNNLFGAVLEDLKCRDPVAFDQVTQYVRRKSSLGDDADLLRHCLADELEKGDRLGEPVMQALYAHQQRSVTVPCLQPLPAGSRRPAETGGAGAAQDPKEAKRQRLEEAKARMIEKKVAGRKDRLQERHGVSTESARRALMSGLIRPDGTPNTAAFYRQGHEQRARNMRGADGRLLFVDGDGTPDMTAYFRHQKMQHARNMKGADGQPLFVRADDSVDMFAYYRHMRERDARSIKDADGRPRFVLDDGSLDMTAYYRYRRVGPERAEDGLRALETGWLNEQWLDDLMEEEIARQSTSPAQEASSSRQH